MKIVFDFIDPTSLKVRSKSPLRVLKVILALGFDLSFADDTLSQWCFD